jgi:hypothetical protein
VLVVVAVTVGVLGEAAAAAEACTTGLGAEFVAVAGSVLAGGVVEVAAAADA